MPWTGTPSLLFAHLQPPHPPALSVGRSGPAPPHPEPSLREVQPEVETRSPEVQTPTGKEQRDRVTGPQPLSLPPGADVDLLMDDEELHLRKLAALGRLSGSVAHDFNNLLTVILGAAGALLQTPPQEDPTESIREIQDSALRARQLTRQILSISSRTPTHPKSLDVSAQIRELTRLMGRILGDRMELDCSLPPDLPSVSMDPGKLDQVILNLVVNARDAMGGRGTLTIRTSAETLQSGDDTAPHTGVRIEVADTGQGMDLETRSRIFEPFFTTKGSSGGTGLGLATVFGIVSEAGGHIQVESEPGVGTTFHLWLPARRDPRHGTSTSAPELPSRQGHRPANDITSPGDRSGRTVLVVEDEPSVRRLITRILRNGGQRVLEGGSVAEGLALVHEEPGIDLIITDLVLPDASGLDLLATLESEGGQEEPPPVILMSGYSRDEAGPMGEDQHQLTFLPKPFSVHELERAVQTALAGPVN